MKKVSIILAIVAIFTFKNANTQEGFSAKAGINIVSVKFDGLNLLGFSYDFTESETGFYVGGGYKFPVSDTFSVEPAVLFSLVNRATSLYIPVMGQYYFTDNFYAQAGPQINYLLEDIDDGALGVDVAIGGGYNINEEWYVEARYGFEVFRGGDYGEFTSINTFSIGAGYRFK